MSRRFVKISGVAALSTLLAILAFAYGRSATQIDTSSLLWKIEGPDIETSYLFGTIHVMPRSQFAIDERILEAFKACDQVVLELDLDDINIQSEVFKYATMKDGMTLDSLLSDEDYEFVEAIVQETLGIGLASFNRFKPFVVSTFLLSRYVGESPASFEFSLVRMAQEQEKAIEGLETMERQMSVFDEIPYDVQAQELVEMVRDEDEVRADYATLLSRYHQEDLQGLYRSIVDRMTSPDQIDPILYDRNIEWIPRMTEMAADTATFFAVGAAHLGGDQGVIALLRQEGYTVTAVPKTR